MGLVSGDFYRNRREAAVFDMKRLIVTLHMLRQFLFEISQEIRGETTTKNPYICFVNGPAAIRTSGQCSKCCS